MITQIPNSRRRTITAVIHIIGWGFIFALPFLLMNRNGFTVNWANYMRHDSIVPFSFVIVFYINYYLLIPHYLFKGRTKQYIGLNIALIAGLAAGIHFWQDFVFHTYFEENMPKRNTPAPPRWIFIWRDTFSMVLTVGLSAAIRMSGRWVEAETARREAEKSRAEAELKNLRNQLNPHFLLNTLNNIYALIAFDGNKAQQAVQELSHLLRHVLYDNQQNFVTLDKEMNFIRNYIELMRIRLSSHVSVETHFDIHPESKTEIAPLIFISLIENAFKHGISPTEPSFIRIHFSETDDCIRCEIINSYHPKSRADKSGSGIGLEQVQKRLDLTYPGHYQWNRGIRPNGKQYESRLEITVR